MSSAAGKLEKMLLSEATRWLEGGSDFPRKGTAAETLIDVRLPRLRGDEVLGRLPGTMSVRAGLQDQGAAALFLIRSGLSALFVLGRIQKNGRVSSLEVSSHFSPLNPLLGFRLVQRAPVQIPSFFSTSHPRTLDRRPLQKV